MTWLWTGFEPSRDQNRTHFGLKMSISFGKKKAGPQKTGPDSQRFPRILRNRFEEEAKKRKGTQQRLVVLFRVLRRTLSLVWSTLWGQRQAENEAWAMHMYRHTFAHALSRCQCACAAATFGEAACPSLRARRRPHTHWMQFMLSTHWLYQVRLVQLWRPLRGLSNLSPWLMLRREKEERGDPWDKNKLPGTTKREVAWYNSRVDPQNNSLQISPAITFSSNYQPSGWKSCWVQSEEDPDP